MQLCDGSLQDEVTALPPGRESAPERLRLARGVVEAVASVHLAGVTHFVRRPSVSSRQQGHFYAYSLPAVTLSLACCRT